MTKWPAIVQQYALPDVQGCAAATDTGRVRKFILKRKGEILADITPEPPDWPEPEYGAAAADGVESFELRFETTWGSNWSVDPLAEGTVYELDEEGEWVAANRGDAGATAGPASPQEEADIGVKDAALITVMGLYPDLTVQGVTLWLPIDRVSPGAKLSIGVDAGVGGVIWQIPPGKTEPEGFIPVTAGGIELTEAGSEPGASISGRLYAEAFGALSYDDTAYSGRMEMPFETTWGSNNSVNPFEEGTVTRLLSDDEAQFVEGFTVIAGHAGPDERLLLPDVEDLASISAFSFDEKEGNLFGLTFVLPMSRLTDGATLVIGQDPVAGGVWGMPPGSSVLDFYQPFGAGTLTLSRAGAEPGAVITGSFTGYYGEISDAGDTGGDTILDISLVINEVAAKGDPLDWFELYNGSDSDIALGSFVVADDLEDAGKRAAFPSDVVIAPGAYLLVEVDNDGWPGFALGGDEELGVWTSEGVLVDSVDWADGDSGEGESFSRIPDGTGEFQTVSNPTPGAPNQPGN